MHKVIFLVILCCALPSTAHSKWEVLSENVTAFDMQANGKGLVAYGPPGFFLEKRTPTSNEGVLSSMTPITSVDVVSDDLAYIIIRDSGLYRGNSGWTKWTKIDLTWNARILLALSNMLIVQQGVKLLHYDGGRLREAQLQLNPANQDTFIAMDYDSDTNLYAATTSSIYSSNDRGRNWQLVHAFGFDVTSLYIDRYNDRMYVGGVELHVSDNDGQSWKAIPFTSIGQTTGGNVYGAPDCSGAFYITPAVDKRPDILGSKSQGLFIQAVGTSPRMTYSQPVRFLTFHRGRTVYWQEPNLHLYVSHDGIDGSVPDSTAFHFIIEPATSIVHEVCTGGTTAFTVDYENTDCATIFLDSFQQLSGKGKVTLSNTPFEVRTEAEIVYHYSHTTGGRDTVRLRNWIHLDQVGKREFKDFTIIVNNLSEPPELDLSQLDIDFGQLKVDSNGTRSIEIFNLGCDTLRVDSIVSSNPAVFRVAPKTYPLKIGRGGKTAVTIEFKPGEEGDFLDALEIGTNAGHRYVSLFGSGRKDPVLGVDRGSSEQQLVIYPNPATSAINVSKAGVYRIHDNLGGLIVAGSTAEGATIEIAALSAGSYWLVMDGKRARFIKE